RKSIARPLNWTREGGERFAYNGVMQGTARLAMFWTGAAVLLAAGFALAQGVTTVSKGDASQQQTARQITARTAAEWQAIWRAHAPDSKAPAVDFSTRMVV